MSVLDNTKFILDVCDMYYHQGLSQKEISAKLSISRPQVSRIIAVANEKKLVTIHFNYPNLQEAEYQKALTSKYGVDCLVFDTDKAEGDLQYKLLAEKCADYLSLQIKDGDRVGVMSSRTIRYIADSIPSSKYHGLTYIPLCGGYSITGTNWYSNSIAQTMAHNTNGEYYVFNAPYYVNSSHAKEILMAEPNMKQLFEMIATCTICFVGIGTVDSSSSGARAGQLTEEELQNLKDQHAIANVCSTYIDAEGNILDTGDDGRRIAASLNDIRNSKIYGVACGQDKTEAIKAVLKGKLIDVLVTSLDTAKQIVNH